MPFNSLQQTCRTVSCAIEFGQGLLRRQERRELRKAKAKLRPRSKYLADAQRAFNAFIRERDRFMDCISCDKPASDEPNAWDCGHYRTVGACPELRFHPLNANRQSKDCNSGVRRTKRYVVAVHDPERQETIHARYREKLIERIGIESVEWIEGPHEPMHYTVEDLIAIRTDYAGKLKALKARRDELEGLPF